MPSRRTILGTASAVTGGLLAGCTSLIGGVDGYVQWKHISGVPPDNEQTVEGSVIRVSLSSPPGSDEPQLNYLNDDWADRFDTPHNPVVSDTLADDLLQTYDDVRYVVGVCSPSWADDEGESVGCYNVSTTRENFNSVQVHDHVKASSDGTYLTVHSREGAWSFTSE